MEHTNYFLNNIALLHYRNITAVTYHVSIRTGDVFGAGTDAKVYVNLIGENADTGKRELHQAENHRNKFERGRTDLFYIEAADLGKVRSWSLINVLLASMDLHYLIISF